MGNLQTIRLPKEMDSKVSVGVDSGKAVHIGSSGLRNGNDGRQSLENLIRCGIKRAIR
jgi:hypothetical protein